jgi:hypothetical protein
MEILQSQHQLPGIEPCLLLRNPFPLGQQVEELAAGAVVEHEVELLVGLEGRVQMDYEWVREFAQDSALRHGLTLLPRLLQLFLLKDFEGVELMGLKVSAQDDLGVGAFSDDRKLLERGQRHILHSFMMF